MLSSQTTRDAQRLHDNQAELTERIAWELRENGTSEPLDGVRLRRSSSPTELGHGVSFPSFCIIAQGSKEVRLGDNRYFYNPANYLIASTTLPIASRISEASPEKPYLGLVVRLDAPLVASVLADASNMAPIHQPSLTAMDVSALDQGLLDAAVRLIRLLDNPVEAHLFLPLIVREMINRLMIGDQGGRLLQIAALGPSNRIAAAVERLRRNFDQPLRIDEIAREYGMSVSGFHHHFREFTAMSPLQFQKQLRLQEARRLIIGEGFDAASAGFRVGYSDASHFTREYKRLFGAPPMRDAEQLRTSFRESVGQGAV